MICCRKTLHDGQNAQFRPNCEAIKYEHKLFARSAKLCACNNCDGLIDLFAGDLADPVFKSASSECTVQKGLFDQTFAQICHA